MKTKLIFLRHVDTQKDKNLHATQWGLSEVGERQAQELATEPLLQDIDAVYLSEEKKTLLTVAPLLQKIQKEPIVRSGLGEVRRGDAFLTKEQFETEKTKQLIDLDYPAFGGETAREALARFLETLEHIHTDHEGETVLIVTHGTILNVYFAHILQKWDHIVNRWEQTAFGAIGVIEDGVVLKDIVL